MSYDIDVVITRTLHSENYTSNVSDMYYHAWDQIKHKLDIPDYELLGGDWKQAIQLDQPYSMKALREMIIELKENPKVYKQMEPSNGWGNYEGAIEFLERAHSAMLMSEDARLILSY